MKKILIVFGTRPEAIKMAPLVKEMQRWFKFFDTKVCVTAQHRQMLDQVLHIFDIKPDFDLNVMKEGQDLYDITSSMLTGLKEILHDYKPDLVLVHGDTTTGFVASLAAFYQRIPSGHVEAGLRTYDIYSPWPEELNRQLITRIANYHFAPTKIAKMNLITEKVPEDKIIVTGNTVIDALLMVGAKINNNKCLKESLHQTIKTFGYEVGSRKIILITGHRRENFGQGFINICTALKNIAEVNPNIDLVYPVHLNPNVRKPVNQILADINNVYIIEPLEYEAFVYLMGKSYFVLTDSGGIQEEAPSLGKPVLVMRDTTERPEAVEAGTVKLVGTDTKKITQETQTLLDKTEVYDKMALAHNPYGDGKACQKIVEFINRKLNEIFL